jgi:hypothetical protein
LPLVHLLLKLDVPLDDRLVDADGGREEALRPELVPPVQFFTQGNCWRISRLVLALIFPTMADTANFGGITATRCT